MAAATQPRKEKISDASIPRPGVCWTLLGNESTSRPHFLSSVITVLGGQAGCVLLAAVSEILYARLLGPAPRGQISLCTMAIGFGVLIGGLGGEVPLVLWTADPKKRPRSWLPAIISWAVMGCLTAISLWAAIYWRWHPVYLKGVTPRLAAIVLATIPCNVAFAYALAVLTGGERFRLQAVLGVIDQAAGLTGFIAFFFLSGRNAEAAMAGNLVGLLVGTGIALALVRSGIRNHWDTVSGGAKVRTGLLTGLRGQFGNVATYFNYRLDVFIVNYFLNPTQVGLYALGVLISEGLWQIPQAVSLVLFPRTARTMEDEATGFTCLIVRQIFVISCAFGVAIILVSPVLVPLIFGGRFAGSVAVIWWIMPGTVALSVGKVAAADLAGRGKTGYSTTFAFVALAVTVVLDLILIPRFGIRGAALASSAAYFTDAVLLVIALKHELKVPWTALLLPSLAEFRPYYQLWIRFRYAPLWTGLRSRRPGRSLFRSL
jgi:O-antigen/teichoic acid export membrane protein